MNENINASNTFNITKTSVVRFAFLSSVLMVLLTVITFSFAIIAVPISGANVPNGDGISYPYLETIKQFPKDFIWQMLACFQIISYLIFIVAIYNLVKEDKKIFAQLNLIFSTIMGAVLLINYYIQFTVIPISLISNELDGIPLLIQYNPHGLFIAMEELGYFLMSLSFLTLGLTIKPKNKLEFNIKWIFIISFILVIISFIIIMFLYGINRKDRFETLIISINWIALIVNSILFSILFKKYLKIIINQNK